MTTTIKHLIESRVSTTRYQGGRELPEPVIRELVQLATRAPTAFNLQNWKFIAVQSAAAKARLYELAYQQRQVLDASVTFIVCGTLEAHTHLAQHLQPSVDVGILPVSVQQSWTDMVNQSHADNPQLQREEAVRSASLAAMTLMLAAQGMGLASGAMTGFDAEGVAQAFALEAHEPPILLVTVGYAAEGNWPQKVRRPVQEVLAFA
ncbi:nitroreductase family protein [Pseudomonas anguilliseptica]|uniref:nitroreductase family protein n=1 Tax=Pseudomonas anguilliseptica TaxID=53406 RepID=UPI0022AFDC47|nr:nitroreductase family protein [Pseudomonas anguilliseptica]MCZ4321876.1 nitroreductase family protein [Pseudomonas anguilliseptica]